MFKFFTACLPAVIARREGYYISWSDIEPFIVCFLLGALFCGFIEFLIYVVKFFIFLYRRFLKRGD